MKVCHTFAVVCIVILSLVLLITEIFCLVSSSGLVFLSFPFKFAIDLFWVDFCVKIILLFLHGCPLPPVLLLFKRADLSLLFPFCNFLLDFALEIKFKKVSYVREGFAYMSIWLCCFVFSYFDTSQCYPGRGNLSWENASLRLDCRQACCIFWLLWESPNTLLMLPSPGSDPGLYKKANPTHCEK